jgi:hypothetical protein
LTWAITNMLIEQNSVSQDEFIEQSKPYIDLGKQKKSFPFVERWKKFVA